MHVYRFTSEAVSVKEKEDRVCINVSGKATHQGLVSGFMLDAEFTIFKDGIMLTEIHATPFGQMHNTMLRFGVVFEMAKQYDNVSWYGRGEIENYCDRNLSAPFGLYSTKVENMNFSYEIPQECGTRTDVRFATVSSKDASLNIIGCDSLTFSYHDFSQEALHKALHENELKKSDRNYLYVDYAMRGLGNHSCGPDPEPQYELPVHEFTFALASGLDNDEANELSKKNFGTRSVRITEGYENPTFERIMQMFDCDR